MTQAPPNLTEIRDPAACDKLLSLLGAAVRDLRALGETPIVIASCPGKFNDAWNDRDWRGIRIGSFFSERTEYFGRPEDHEKNLRDGPENARAASRILEDLEAHGWRSLYQSAFEREDISYEEVIALVLQDGSAWLVLNGSNSGESAVYVLTADGQLVHVGRCDDYAERFDQGLTAERPLVIRFTENDELDLAALARRIEILEATVAQDSPDWYNQMHVWPATHALSERIEMLAKTGRVSILDYQSLKDVISRCVG